MVGSLLGLFSSKYFLTSIEHTTCVRLSENEMKSKRLPPRYTKHFAWWPVWLTHGAHDCGRYAWFETIYWKQAESSFGSQASIQSISKRDHEYNKQLLFKMKTNPDRYGYDPFRGDE